MFLSNEFFTTGREKTIMKDAADHVGIEDQLFETDFTAEIRKIVNLGLSR